MMMMDLPIPEGLGDLLRDFTVAVLKERPTDLYDFAVDYFVTARDNHHHLPHHQHYPHHHHHHQYPQQQQQQQLQHLSYYCSRSSCGSSRHNPAGPLEVPMYIIVEDDSEAGEPDPGMFKPRSATTAATQFARRHSVSAERYNPEEDDDDDENRVVWPKSDSQRQRLTEAVSGILLFKCLEHEQMQEVLDAMFEKQVNPGETVIIQGDDGDNFYVIDSGVYDVLVSVKGDEKKVYQFDNKGSFGELALMYNMPRSATVRAVTPGTLWAMDRNSFRKIVLKSAFRKRKKYESLLEGVNILQCLDSYERMTLADALVTQVYEDGESIIEQGDTADGMYFVEDGHLKVTIASHDGQEQEITQQQTAYFGELALINNKPRTANVYAVGKVKVAFLERECFERLLGPCMEIMKRNSQLYTMYADQ
ncbi:hypothetical protein ACOMHN_065202 [Nucella lapillus]